MILQKNHQTDSFYSDDCNKLIDVFIDFIDDAKNAKVLNYSEPELIASSLSGLITNDGQGLDALIKVLSDTVFKYSVNLHSPMYMGHQVSPPLKVSILLDLIVSSLNQSLAVYRMSPVLSILEKELIAFLSNKIGYNIESSGSITSGGSASNLLGLVAAREKFFPSANIDKAIILCSEQTHYSIKKAAKICGFSDKNFHFVPVDENFKIIIPETENIIKQLASRGLKPFFINANAGSTSTGSFDNIEDLSILANKYNMWLHVDGAHGASLIFSEKLKHLLQGIENADSVSWDGHKMLFQPSSLGICLFKDGQNLKKCFIDSNAPYLYNSCDDSYDLSKLSLQCTKRGDALKLWGSLVTYGTDFFGKRLEHLSDVTNYFYNKLLTDDIIEPIHKPEFNIFCFRYNPKNKNISESQLNEINSNIRDSINNSGEAMITLTVLNKKVCLRTTIINPETSYCHIDNLIKFIKESI